MPGDGPPFNVFISRYIFLLYINHFSMLESSIFAAMPMACILLTNITSKSQACFLRGAIRPHYKRWHMS